VVEEEEEPPETPEIQAACVTSTSQALVRWYGCSNLDTFASCGMDQVYSQQANDGTRCYDCHQGASSSQEPAGGLVLSDSSEDTWMGFRNPPGSWKLAAPVSGPMGYAGLAMNDIMVRKGLIDNDGHPNYEFDDERLAALDCYMGATVGSFADCSQPCDNP
jgi:hypothetical protein